MAEQPPPLRATTVCPIELTGQIGTTYYYLADQCDNGTLVGQTEITSMSELPLTTGCGDPNCFPAARRPAPASAESNAIALIVPDELAEGGVRETLPRGVAFRFRDGLEYQEQAAEEYQLRVEGESETPVGVVRLFRLRFKHRGRPLCVLGIGHQVTSAGEAPRETITATRITPYYLQCRDDRILYHILLKSPRD